MGETRSENRKQGYVGEILEFSQFGHLEVDGFGQIN